MFNSTKRKLISELEQKLAAIQERSNLLDEACGIGLWEAVLHNGDALHPQSQWTWSAEFRRLLGYTDAHSFPNVVQSWSDKLHPDDVAPTFAAFADHLKDKTGKSRYSVNYRLKMHDGSYQWFRATGGCAHQSDGTTIRACGSLTNVNSEMLLKQSLEQEAASDQLTVSALAEALAQLAQGNLTHRITTEFGAKAAGLRADFNETASKLQEALNAVSISTSAILSGSSEISSGSADLSKRTEQQAAYAGVEAARAGEAGKGFAVVAQEVRELAQRSAQAAKEIKELIRNSSLEVESGVTLVSQTGDALKTIEGYIVTINQHMDAIATSAKEQSVGLAEVNTAVNQMDQFTQQNAAMVEESNAASATLAAEATRLSDLVSQFQLGSSLRRSAPVMAANMTHRPVQSAVGQMTDKVAKAFSGNGSLKQAWQDF